MISGFKKHPNVYNKYRISETERATNFLKATVYFQDVMYTRICDLEDSEALFDADIFYHSVCMGTYLKKYKDVGKIQVESIIKFENGYIS